MANVKFKRGTQAKLNELTSYVEGSFYLTTDSDRLYFAQSANELVALNQFIRTVTALPEYNADMEVGDMYYIPNSNILAVIDRVDKTAGKVTWAQLNPDTYLAASTSNVSVADANDTVTISTDIQDSAGHHSRGSFQMVGGGIATVSASGNTITISVPEQSTYALSVADKATGEHVISLDKTTAGTTANVGEVGVAAGKGISVTVSNGVMTINNTFANDDYSIEDGINKEVGASFGATGVLNVSVKDGGGTKSATVTPTIKFGHSVDADGAVTNDNTATFNNSIAILDVYTAEEVDAAIEKALGAADAMTYQGLVSVGDYADKLVSTANVGDTFKASGAFNFSDNGTVKSVAAGDLIIATGEDGKVTWDVIHSAGDQVITGTVTNNTMAIKDNGTTLAAIKVVGDEMVTVTASTVGNTITYSAAHAALEEAASGTATTSITQSAENTATLTAITGVTVDDYGHISGWETTEFTVTDTHNKLTNNELTATVSDNVVTLSSKVSANDGSKTANMTLTSSTLAFTATTSSVNVELEWDTF